MNLAPADKATSTWRALFAHYTARLQMLREQNDARRSIEDTAHLRGQIAEIKELLRLADEDRTQRQI